MPTPDEFRAHFPICAERAYLASCSLGAQSDQVIAAMADFMASWREQGAPWERWVAVVERARAAFARVVGAVPSEIAALPSASEGAFQVASTFDWRRRPRIVACDMEFPSVAQVWLAQSGRGAEVVYAPERGGYVAPEDYAALIDERAALVSVPFISYKNGARLHAKEIARTAREAGARVFVDAYQATGVGPVDVGELDCDYLVAGTLKYLFGAPGLAFLYVRRGLSQDLDPQLTGWFGRRDPFAFKPRTLDFPDEARRYEIGTPSIPAAYAALAGLSLIETLSMPRVEGHIAELSAHLTSELLSAGMGLYSPLSAERRGPQVAVLAEDPPRLGAFLADRGVIASPRGRAVRLSLHYYSNAADLDRVLDAIWRWRS